MTATREPLAPPPLVVVDPSAAVAGQRIVVKFRDAWRMRSDADGNPVSRSGRETAPVLDVARAFGLTFRPLIETPEERVDDLLARAAARSGHAQPDLRGFLIAEHASADGQLRLLPCRVLGALESVEYAYLQSLGVAPPGDIAPTTPDLSVNQGYVAPDPGIDAAYAHALGLSGAGLKLSDCEYGWIASHEDLCTVDLHPEPGQTPTSQVSSFGWDDHGTAAIGITSAAENGYGIDGLATNAAVYTYPEWTIQGGLRRLTSITNAIADSSFGDVVMLEMQELGPTGNFAPAEVDPAIWSVTRAGVDAGVVVVAAAGNGGDDLDGPAYATYASWGDSGAILVSAGTPSASHSAEFFSNYGTRVDLQGWGSLVYSLGYGSAAIFGSDPNQTYSWFSGTSSATPMVASACLLVQEHAVNTFGNRLAPEDLRQHLIDTGTPEGPSPFGQSPIGPLPDLRAALDSLGSPFEVLGSSLPGTQGPLAIEGFGTMQPGAALSIHVTNALANAPLVLVIGFTANPLPLFGGQLWPNLDVILSASPTNLAGSYSITAKTPPVLATGEMLVFQAWVADAGAVQGVAATPGLLATVP